MVEERSHNDDGTNPLTPSLITTTAKRKSSPSHIPASPQPTLSSTTPLPSSAFRSRYSPLPPPPPPSAPPRLLFPGSPYAAQLLGPTVVLPPSPPSTPHPLHLRHFTVPGPDGLCHLSLVDALFLTYALPVLSVRGEEGGEVSAQDLLVRGCEVERRFPSLFAVFAHFTALGWVVRQGSKMGVDFLLYPHHSNTRTHSRSLPHTTTATAPHSGSERRTVLQTRVAHCCLCAALSGRTCSFSVLVLEEGRDGEAGRRPLHDGLDWTSLLRVQRAVKKVSHHHHSQSPNALTLRPSNCTTRAAWMELTQHLPLSPLFVQRLLVCSTKEVEEKKKEEGDVEGESKDREELWRRLLSCQVSDVVLVGSRGGPSGSGEEGEAKSGAERVVRQPKRSRMEGSQRPVRGNKAATAKDVALFFNPP